ncbi:MAG: hypothetical protein JWM00_562 [Candidatus Saccharibacteria bacterium]|nr:hypothetical protein [Candidatus Saccharibacteria bacterium]
MATPSPEQSPTTRRAAVWNIFLDKHYLQDERLPSIIETLREQGEFDVVGIVEAGQGNGEKIAQAISGTPGLWYPHSRKKLGEHIGLFGPTIEPAEKIELGYNRRAVVTRLGDVAITAVHLRRPDEWYRSGPEQVEQAQALIDYFADEEKVILFGDFNGVRAQKPRRMLKAADYELATTQLGRRPVRSFPTDEFPERLSRREQLLLRLVGGMISIDAIYTKGVDVIDTDSFGGPSDHRGLWLEWLECVDEMNEEQDTLN